MNENLTWIGFAPLRSFVVPVVRIFALFNRRAFRIFVLVTFLQSLDTRSTNTARHAHIAVGIKHL